MFDCGSGAIPYDTPGCGLLKGKLQESCRGWSLTLPYVLAQVQHSCSTTIRAGAFVSRDPSQAISLAS